MPRRRKGMDLSRRRKGGNGSGGWQHVERWRKKNGKKLRREMERKKEKVGRDGERWREEVKREKEANGSHLYNFNKLPDLCKLLY